MARRTSTTTPADEPGTGSAPAPAAEAAPAPFSPIASAPYGTPIRVREGGQGEEIIGIRSHIVGWYNEGRSATLTIKPTEWAPLSKP
jgi:hypothetical protein